MGQLSLREIVVSGGITLALLVGLSVFSIALIWERWKFLRRETRGLAGLLDAVRKSLTGGDLSGALAACSAHPGLAAGIIKAALVGPPSRDDRERAARRAADRALALFLDRVPVLGTIGSTAPFIGLFGTVVGVMRAFRDLAGAAGAGPGVVAIGISEALVCTATGLFVAIPAVAAYNYFNNRADRFAEEMDWISSEILEHLSEAARTAPQAGG